MLEDEMLTIDDLAAYLKLKPQTIYRWAQAGKIPGAKFGKEWRFRRSAIERWIEIALPLAAGDSAGKAEANGGKESGGKAASQAAARKPARKGQGAAAAAGTKKKSATKAPSPAVKKLRGPEAN